MTILTKNFVLRINFTFVSYTNANPYVFKEHAINVNAKTLTLTFVPSKNSVAFVNGIWITFHSKPWLH